MVKGLGLTKISVARAAVISHAIENLREVEARLELMKNDRFMGGVEWEKVSNYLLSYGNQIKMTFLINKKMAV